MEELFSFIENKKYNLIEENKEISLIFQLPVHKVKEIKFSLKQKEKSDNEKINELYNIIGNLKKENSLLKEENNILKKRLDNNDNLIIVCPNCHRVIHTTDKYSEEFLLQYSIEKEFYNWRNFYYPSN